MVIELTSFPHTLCSAVKVSQECVGGEWEVASVTGCWTVGSTAGGGRNFTSHGQNPHVPLTVTYDPGGTNVRVTLRQHSPPNTSHAIGFHIYKVSSAGGQTVTHIDAIYVIQPVMPVEQSETQQHNLKDM